jgi:predicted transposase YbfD/YdcC
MDAQATTQIPRAFLDMPDPRRNNCRHMLTDLITISLLAIICGADGWAGVEAYGLAKLSWLKTFLELPHGIPTHDTFGRVFAQLDPQVFESRFQAWMAAMVELSGGKLVALDGKSLRRSFEHAWDKSGMAHMVSAFVQGNSMVFAQEKTDGKGQELSAIEKLLGMLDLNGAVVTIDAIGTQKQTAGQILDAGANYVLQVKDNQPTLHGKVAAAMDDAILDNFKDLSHDFFEETDAGHDRVETRKLWVCWDTEKLLGEMSGEWRGLKALIRVERTRESARPGGGRKTSVEKHCYIASLDRRTHAKRLASYIRGHWSIENNLHWQLDVSFREDERRIRTGHGPENFSRLCRIALNMLKKEKTCKRGIAIKRQKSGWNNDYLVKVLTQ